MKRAICGEPGREFRSPDPARNRLAVLLPLAVIGLLLVVRCIAVFRLQADSDESQHLHLIYGWLNGELPYRDRFDNHTPLLYLLFLPLAALAGETPHIILLARIAEFPISLAILVLIYLIGRRLTDRQVALWTVATVLALADWSLKSLEFRPDVLWSFCWFLAIWVLVKAPDNLNARRFFAAGLILGTALCFSIKTTFLATAFALAWLVAWALCEDLRRALPPRSAGRCALAAGAGFLIVPTVVFGWLISEGTSVGTLRFCLFEANRADFELGRVAWFLTLAVAALWLAWKMATSGVRGATLAVFLGAAIYMASLIGFSPELRKQSLLPVYPILVLFAWQCAAQLLRRKTQAINVAGLCVCALASIHFLVEARLWEDGLRDQRELLRDTLKLTQAGDYLIDRKGETIFRRRPVYLVYQHATVRAIEEGRLSDPDPEALSSTATAVAINESMGLTDQMRKFLRKNYVPVGDGRLRVAGRSLLFYEEAGHLAARAPVMIPGQYVVVRNGNALQETRVEKPGWHDVDLGGQPGPASLFWKPAWDAGFRPLNEIDTQADGR
jgi:hypothetical protein